MHPFTSFNSLILKKGMAWHKVYFIIKRVNGSVKLGEKVSQIMKVFYKIAVQNDYFSGAPGH